MPTSSAASFPLPTTTSAVGKAGRCRHRAKGARPLGRWGVGPTSEVLEAQLGRLATRAGLEVLAQAAAADEAPGGCGGRLGQARGRF